MPNPFLVEFLSACLGRFMVLSTYRGQRWTKSRVADYITGSDGIPGIVSDTTIGRLLDPGCKQEPSEATLGSVAAFLVKMTAITPQQIVLARQSPSLIEATSFASAFPRPATASYSGFLQSVVGRYSAIEARGSDLLASEIAVRLFPDEGVLIAQEVVAFYRVNNTDLLKRETRNLSPDSALDIRSKLRLTGGQEIDSATSTGFAVATPEIMAFFLRGAPAEFHSIITVEEIEFDEDDKFLGIGVRRNTGWLVAGVRKRSDETKTLRSAVRSMAATLEYRKYYLDRYSENSLKRDKISKERLSKRDFFNQGVTIDPVRNGEIIEDEQNIAEILIAAMDQADLDAFRVALNEGGDPNLIYPGSTDPIVFILAANGRLEFVEALLATGRCDLTRVGSSGLTASYAPGVTARFFAPTGPAELVERFKQIALMLLDEEFRQLRQKPSTPSHDF